MAEPASFTLSDAQEEIDPLLRHAWAHDEIADVIEKYRALDDEGRELLFTTLAYEAHVRTGMLWEIVMRTSAA